MAGLPRSDDAMTSFSGTPLVLLDGRDAMNGIWLLDAREAFSGTGFSREEVGVNAMKLAV